MQGVETRPTEWPNFENSLSYSKDNKDLLIGAIAVAAIAIIALAFAVATWPLLAVVSLVAVGIGIGMVITANSRHNDEIAQKNYEFACEQTDVKVQLTYLQKAIGNGHPDAIMRHNEIITGMFERGRTLILEACDVSDEREKLEKIDQGIQLLEDAKNFGIKHTPGSMSFQTPQPISSYDKEEFKRLVFTSNIQGLNSKVSLNNKINWLRPKNMMWFEPMISVP